MTAFAHTFPLNTENSNMPAVGFGTYLISSDDTAKAVSSAIACDYRHVDTAAVYDNGHGVGEGMARVGIAATMLLCGS
ncbi:hypothetical protein [Burkholderia pyrrocinia]|uniref:hypothetical protein n=1 Tax=Burkholderia pyrrocinia TaxID=60550 RepID=UPI002AB10209|nr:hypothetical protein [Burkholderia pyrrocinia]